MTPTTIERFFTWLLIGSALIPSVLFADDDFAAQLKETDSYTGCSGCFSATR